MTGRKKLDLPKNDKLSLLESSHAAGTEMAVQEAAHHEAEAAALARTQALAKTLNYEGEISIPALENHARYVGGQAVSTALELGKTFLLLKEMTPHGDFGARIQAMGFPVRYIQRVMHVTAETAKNDKLSLLAIRTKNVAVLSELLDANDEVLENLTEADDIELLTASEAKRRVRELQEQLVERDEQLDTEKEKVKAARREWVKATPDAKVEKLRKNVRTAADEVLRVLSVADFSRGLHAAARMLLEDESAAADEQADFLAGLFAELIAAVSVVRDNLPVSVPILEPRLPKAGDK